MLRLGAKSLTQAPPEQPVTRITTHGTATGTNLCFRPCEGVGQLLLRLMARVRGGVNGTADALAMRVIIIKRSLPFEISSPTPFGDDKYGL